MLVATIPKWLHGPSVCSTAPIERVVWFERDDLHDSFPEGETRWNSSCTLLRFHTPSVFQVVRSMEGKGSDDPTWDVSSQWMADNPARRVRPLRVFASHAACATAHFTCGADSRTCIMRWYPRPSFHRTLHRPSLARTHRVVDVASFSVARETNRRSAERRRRVTHRSFVRGLSANPSPLRRGPPRRVPPGLANPRMFARMPPRPSFRRQERSGNEGGGVLEIRVGSIFQGCFPGGRPAHRSPPTSVRRSSSQQVRPWRRRRFSPWHAEEPRPQRSEGGGWRRRCSLRSCWRRFRARSCCDGGGWEAKRSTCPPEWTWRRRRRSKRGAWKTDGRGRTERLRWRCAAETGRKIRGTCAGRPCRGPRRVMPTTCASPNRSARRLVRCTSARGSSTNPKRCSERRPRGIVAACTNGW